jgi:hypothetical protein
METLVIGLIPDATATGGVLRTTAWYANIAMMQWRGNLPDHGDDIL